MAHLLLPAACIIALALPCHGQAGDRKDKKAKQTLPADFDVPEAPVVPADEALDTLRIHDGYRLELVAAEPLVHDPVAMAWDADGRLFVCEMRGYMPNVEGEGEDEPVGRVVMLEDTDGDWHYDKSTVFLDKLVMPRAVQVALGGVIVAEPPFLWFCRDTDGDGRADVKEKLFEDYGRRGGQPEHMANSLTWTMDNWLSSARHGRRYRFTIGAYGEVEWHSASAPSNGQWGLSQDDVGRLFYNANSTMLMADLVPPAVYARHPKLDAKPGLAVRLGSNDIHPIRVTPGVNRGYKSLGDDGKLHRVTAACGPTVYRGEQLPKLRGDAFVCDPSVNLVARVDLRGDGLQVKADNVNEGGDFIASTDERFRPVNTYTGPDGCLYVVDMYRGIIQHRAYVTTWLRDQIERRGLERPLGMGRIYRVVPADGQIDAKPPRMSAMTHAQLTAALASDNGWRRDTAQRLLLEAADEPAAVVRAFYAKTSSPSGRLHALRVLQGLQALDAKLIASALRDGSERVRVAALQIALEDDAWLKSPTVARTVVAMPIDMQDDRVLFHLAAALPMIGDEGVARLLALLTEHGEREMIRAAGLSGLHRREVQTLQTIVEHAAGRDGTKAQRAVVSALAKLVIDAGDAHETLQLLAMIYNAATPAWCAAEVEQRIRRSTWVKKKRPIRLPLRPDVLDRIAESRPKSAALLERLLTWPGEKDYVLKKPSEFDLDRDLVGPLKQGHELFTAACAPCHQPDGSGQAGLAPPLAGSAWVNEKPGRLIRIVLHGLHGPIEVDGQQFDLEMPALGSLADEQIAATLSYVRKRFGDGAGDVSAAQVKGVRSATATREQMWTVKELLGVEDDAERSGE